MSLIRKIAVLASARASYGYEKGLIELIHQSKDFELQFIVTGIHLLPEHGYSLKEIADDGFPIAAKVDMMVGGDSPTAWAKSLGLGTISLAQVFNDLSPDLLVLTGDRGETLAAAMTASYMNIPVAHVQAGDVSGHIDGSARHAITKLSHLFFPSCEESAERVFKLGEEPWRVHDVGSPQIDILRKMYDIPVDQLSKRIGFDLTKPTLLVIQHAVLSETEKATAQMVETMEAIKASGLNTVVIYPNNDAGGRKIIEVIERYSDEPTIKGFENLDRDVLINLLRNVKAIVGNSSCGILEGPYLKLPAVNIGSRQDDRLRSENLIDVPHERNEILKAIQYSVFDEKFRERVRNCRNPYGDGTSSQKIIKVIRDMNAQGITRDQLLRKKMTY